jgi:hypothetical protein
LSDTLFLEKIPGYAQPADDETKEIFDTFRIGQKFEILPWKERNYLFHKKLFALLNLVAYRNPRWKSAHFLLKIIQMDIGSVVVGMDFDGKVKQFPESIAFRSMSEPKFTKLFNNVANHILQYLELLLPGMSEQEYKTHVERILLFV